MKTLVNLHRINKLTVTLGLAIFMISSINAQKSVSDLSYVAKTELDNIKSESIHVVRTVLNIFPSFDFDVVAEAPLEVEDWMLNTESWESNYVDEAEMELEDWMLDTKSWTIVEAENEPVLEDWMFNFHEGIGDNEGIVEAEIELEEWMFNLETWNK